MSRPRIIMVTGKGGVGKTTIAMSVAASTPGARLIQFEEPSGPECGGVDRVVLRADECVEHAAAKLLGSKRFARLMLGGESVQALLRLSDAIRVIAVLERVRELQLDGRPLVLDMPATGHALSWFRSVKVFRDLTRRGSAHELVARIGDELLDPARIDVWVVSIPTPVAVAETEELRATMSREMGVEVRVIVNRDSTMPQVMEASGRVHRLPEFSRIAYDHVGRLLGVAA